MVAPIATSHPGGERPAELDLDASSGRPATLEGMSSAPRPAVLRWSVSIALAGLVLLVGSLAVFVFTRAGQRVDATMQSSVSTLGLLQLHNQWIVSAITPGTLALATLLTVSVGLARRRWDAVAAALILLVGANVTTALMKQTIPRPDYGFGEPNSSPAATPPRPCRWRWP